MVYRIQRNKVLYTKYGIPVPKMGGEHQFLEKVFMHWHRFVAESIVDTPSHFHIAIHRSSDNIRNV